MESCGNGAFTEELIVRSAPAAVTAVDPSDEQLAFARSRPGTKMAQFRRGDAQAASRDELRVSLDVLVRSSILIGAPLTYRLIPVSDAELSKLQTMEPRTLRVAGGIEVEPLSALAVIVPNLHWHYSGVTATNRAVAPRLAKHFPAAWFGPDAPPGIQRLAFADLLALRFGAERQRWRIWHARRNNEMLVGLLLKAFGWPLKLVFTSAAQRHHSWITWAMVARMDAVIATSQASASFLRRPVTVVPHGVDAERYRPAPDRNAEFAVTGLPGKYVIGCFGRVRAQKGTDLFVEAMCRLLPQYPDFSAVIVGPVTRKQRGFASGLAARVQAAGLDARIRFLGEVPIDDVPLWYQRILIYVFTSRVEGFGLTLLEAMSAGAALVASRAGAAEYLISDDSGVLIPPGDADALVRALEPLLRDPARAAAMGAKARARILAEFTIDAEVEKIAALYRHVLEQ